MSRAVSRVLVVAHDVDDTLARSLLSQTSGAAATCRRLGIVRGRRTEATDRFTPLKSHPDADFRERTYRAAKEWSMTAAERWTALRDTMFHGLLSTGDLRITHDQFALEETYLRVAYIADAAAGADTVLFAGGVPEDVVVLGRKVLAARGVRTTCARGRTRRRRLLDRGVVRCLALWVRTLATRRSEPFPPGAVLVEAGSIQSVANARPVVERLVARGVPCQWIGLPRTKVADDSRRFYEIGWIGAQSEPSTVRFGDLLAATPWRVAATIPLLAAAFRVQGLAIRRCGVPVPLLGTTARIETLRCLRSGFAFDYVFAHVVLAAARQLARTSAPRALLVSNPLSTAGRACAAVGAPVVVLQDGMIANEVVRRRARDATLTCVWGDRFRDLLVEEHGFPPERVRVVGPHRFDPRQRVTPPEKDLVLFTHQPTAFGEPADDVSLRWLVTWCVTTGRELLVRAHPRDDVEALAEVVRDLARHLSPGSPMRFRVGSAATPLAEDLAAASVVVSEFSTTIIEAVAAGVPVVVVDHDWRPDMGSLRAVLPDAYVTSPGDLAAVLRRLLDDPGARHAAVAGQRRLLDGFLAPDGSADRVADVLDVTLRVPA